MFWEVVVKKIFLFTFIFLVSCSGQIPQVTVTSEVTVTLPPTEILIPTPTSHPQIIALQELIAASGDRFTLNPDGTIQDGETTISGLHVGKNGKITILITGKPVEIDPSSLRFDYKNGITIDGYSDKDLDGDWVKDVANTEMGKIAIEMFEQVGADPSTYRLELKNDKVLGYDLDDNLIFENERLYFGFAQEALENSGELAPTNIAPLGKGDAVEGSNRPPSNANVTFGVPLLENFRNQYAQIHGVDPFTQGSAGFVMIMLDPSINSWGVVADELVNGAYVNQYLIYNKVDDAGNVFIEGIPVMKTSSLIIRNYWLDKLKP